MEVRKFIGKLAALAAFTRITKFKQDKFEATVIEIVLAESSFFKFKT